MDSIVYIPAKKQRRSNRTAVDLIVIHTVQCGEHDGAAEGTQRYFSTLPDNRTASAHYIVDSDSIACSVLEKDIAWHTPGKWPKLGYVNDVSLGIEHAGRAEQTTEQWADEYSEAVLRRSAELVANLCVKYGIPVRRLTFDELRAGERGICGHKDCTDAFGGRNWDPGPNFPWTRYLAQVRCLASGTNGHAIRIVEPDLLDPRTPKGLQRALVRAGFDLAVDGIVGPKTRAAVVDFQRAEGLAPDGIVGPKTRAALAAVTLREDPA